MTPGAAHLSIDLNGDVGEWDSSTDDGRGASADATLLDALSSVNVACGAHAGDDDAMRATVRLAVARGLAIGAHPGLADRAGFGRRRLDVGPAELGELVAAQVGALRRIAAEEGATVAHVKPHGALYWMADERAATADAIARAVAAIDGRLVVVGRSGGGLLLAAARAGLKTRSEVFCDRGYAADGSLVPRGAPGDIIGDPIVAAARLARMIGEGVVASVDGVDVPVRAETACIHGDHAGAAEFARRIRQALAAAGIRVARPPH